MKLYLLARSSAKRLWRNEGLRSTTRSGLTFFLYWRRCLLPFMCISLALGSLNLHSQSLHRKLTTFPSSFFTSSIQSNPTGWTTFSSGSNGILTYTITKNYEKLDMLSQIREILKLLVGIRVEWVEFVSEGAIIRISMPLCFHEIFVKNRYRQNDKYSFKKISLHCAVGELSKSECQIIFHLLMSDFLWSQPTRKSDIIYARSLIF